MLCLSDNDIIDYITADKADIETIKLVAVVNSHVSICEKCAEKLELAEKLYSKLKKPRAYSDNFIKQLSYVNEHLFDDDDEM